MVKRRQGRFVGLVVDRATRQVLHVTRPRRLLLDSLWDGLGWLERQALCKPDEVAIKWPEEAPGL